MAIATSNKNFYLYISLHGRMFVLYYVMEQRDYDRTLWLELTLEMPGKGLATLAAALTSWQRTH